VSATKAVHCCDAMTSLLREGKVALRYLAKFREYGVLMKRGGPIVQLISYCPWCGRKLPSSLRSLWFARVTSLGLDPYSRKLPSSYMDGSWWLDTDFSAWRDRFSRVAQSLTDELSRGEKRVLEEVFEAGEIGFALEYLTQKVQISGTSVTVEDYVQLATLARFAGRYTELITPRLRALVTPDLTQLTLPGEGGSQ
jgi:hypothetical protein